MRILSVGHSQRQFGKVSNLFSKKLLYGFIRLGHDICEFDDREVARSQSLFKSKFGGTKGANRRFLEVCESFRPSLIFLGHADLISNDTVKQCKALNPGVIIAHWTIDAFYVPRHFKRFKTFSESAEALFATTGGSVLAGFKTPQNRLAYIPNAVDRAIDCFWNDQAESFDVDLLFCGKASKQKRRDSFIEKLAGDVRLGRLRFEVRGMLGKPGVYGDQYDQLLKRSKMGLNLSRDNSYPLCSSDRIAQLLGNGLLTFIPESTGLKEIISAEEAVFYGDYEDLVDKVLYYHSHDAERKRIAEAGRIASHKRFSSERIAKFMIEVATRTPLSEAYEWRDHLFL